MGEIARIPFKRLDGIPAEVGPEHPIPAYIMGGDFSVDVHVPPTPQQYDGNGAAWVAVQNWGQIADTIRQGVQEIVASFDERSALQARALDDLSVHYIEMQGMLQQTIVKLERKVRYALIAAAGWAVVSVGLLVFSIVRS